MIKLTLPLTPLLNRYYRKARNIMYISKDGIAYKQEVAIICQTQGIEPIIGAVAMHAKVYRARKQGDVDGYIKALFDSLQGYAYLNDGQIVDLHIQRYDDKHNPRVEVVVFEIKEQGQ